ncbi:MAG TPA: hypothetical protein VE083_08395 [Terriglobales bacterium]|nr:hypothetical protein [Terriglobales bacterium]
MAWGRPYRAGSSTGDCVTLTIGWRPFLGPEDASALPPNIWAHAPTPGGRACWWIRILRPWGNVGRANLAPDASGISYYDQALFLEIMHASQVTHPAS